MIGLARVLPHMDGFAGPPPTDEEARVAAAHRSGVAEGRAVSEASHAVEIATLVQNHREELRKAREEWAVKEAAELAGVVAGQIRDAETAISNALADIVGAFTRTELPRAAVELMTRKIALAVRGDAARTLTLKGPADLADALALSLGKQGIAVAGHKESSDEVAASDGSFMAVTALERWLKELSHG